MPKKIIVAVHGIGDQVRCETIQSVANAFYRFRGLPTSLPLGHFNAKLVPLKGGTPPPGVLVMTDPPYPKALVGFGFAEVYWAGIARSPERKGYSLEEAKKWIKTVVQRVRAFDRRPGVTRLWTDQDYELAAMVLDEMLEGVRVLERLLFLAEKAGLFRFDLGKVLVDFLGDVQLVTDFENYRKIILKCFDDVMDKAYQQDKSAELYIVAHSEGTVISLLGILGALSTGKEGWVNRLYGLMTIGSPLNKHLLLWPELWEDLKPPAGASPSRKIKWRNYYDFGDPVGFRLDSFREWLKKSNWAPFFQFRVPAVDQGDQQEQQSGQSEQGRPDRQSNQNDDIGFTRYWFPGKSHNDYWADDGVFGHFIQTVIQPAPFSADDSVHAPHSPNYDKPPTTKPFPQLVSPTIPFLASFALILLAVYLLYKEVTEFSPLPDMVDHSYLDTLRSVFGISLLLAGATAAARIPRLTKSLIWRSAGVVFFLLSVSLFPVFINSGTRTRLRFAAEWIEEIPGLSVIKGVFDYAARSVQIRELTGADLFIGAIVVSTLTIIILVSSLRPLWGVKPLIFLGSLVVCIFAALLTLPILSSVREEYKNLRTKVIVEGYHVPDAQVNKLASRLVELKARTGTAPTFGEKAKQSINAGLPSAAIKGPFKAKSADGDSRNKTGQENLPPSDPQKPSQNKGVENERAEAEKSGTGGSSAEDEDTSEAPPLWPVFLAGAAFIYLWWVAALLFDLAVTWHHYIRRSNIINRLQELSPMGQGGPVAASPNSAATPPITSI